MNNRKLRGNGRVYQQKYATGKTGAVWWIAYYARGVRADGAYGSILRRESSKSTERSDAVKLLRRRVAGVTVSKPTDARQERLTLAEMLDALEAHHKVHGNAGCAKATRRARAHLIGFFGESAPVLGITSARIDAYIQTRLQSPQAPAHATINRDLAALRSAFKHAIKSESVAKMPVFNLLKEVEPRQGFIDPEDFNALLAELPEDLRDAVNFLYLSSWRRGAMVSLEWRDVDLKRSVITLRAENAKNGHAQTLPLSTDPQLLAIFKRAAAKRSLACPFVFHRNGSPIGSFRKAWAHACKNVGRPQLLVHDLRRSAIRNLMDAGIDEGTAMAISGHKTRSVFQRYNIQDEKRQAAALALVAAYREARAAAHAAKVVALAPSNAA